MIFEFYRLKRYMRSGFDCFGDVFRRGAAATAQNACAAHSDIVHFFGKRNGIYAVAGAVVMQTRQTGIRVYDDRQRRRGNQTGNYIFICRGPKEQLIPKASTRKPSSIATMLSGSEPVISFSFSSYTFVTNTGREEFSLAAKTAAFVSKESDMVSIRIKSTRTLPQRANVFAQKF